MSLAQLNKLASKDLVVGLPNISFKNDNVYDACVKGKHARSSFKSKKVVSTSIPLELFHKGLCGPMRIMSRSGKRYILVIGDDYTRYTRTMFLSSKDETFDNFYISNQKNPKETMS